MSFTKRVYPSRRKVYIYGSGGVLALLTFIQIYLASYGFDVSDWNGNPFPESLICAGNPQERCLWNISIVSSNYSLIFSNKLNIYTNAEDNDNITVIVRKKDSLGRLRVFNMTGKTLKNDSRWDLQVEIIKPIDKTVKWGINSEGVINSEVLDPIAKGYSKASFMPILTRNEVFFDHGEGEFPVVNPLSYNMTISEKYFGFFFNNVKGYLTKFEVWVGTEKNMTYNETTQVWIPNITTMQIISSNGTYNQTQDNGYFNKTTIQKTGTETVYSLLNATQTYTLRPKEQAKILIKGYWDVKTAYKTGIAIDWFPNLSVSSVSYIRDDWAWWNVSFGNKRQQPISAAVTSKVTMPCLINGTSGFNLGSPSATNIVWTVCEFNSTDEYLYYQNNSYAAYVNETGNVQLNMTNESGVLASYGNVFKGLNGLAERWGLNNDALGSKDVANGTITGATYTTSGKYSGAYNFNVNDNRIQMADSATLEPANVTVEAWIYRKRDSGGIEVIVASTGSDASSVGRGYKLWIGSGDKASIVKGNGTAPYYAGQTCAGTTNIALNSWYHLVGIYNGTGMEIWVNGTKENSCAISGGIGYTNVDRTVIGSEWDDIDGYYWEFNGSIDEVRIYNRALSQNEITAEYNTGNQALGSQIQNCFVAGNPCGLVNTIYLNGTSANRYYELGDQINITATVNDTGGTGTMCLTSSHVVYGTNFTCTSGVTANANITIYPTNTVFNDGSSSKTLSSNGNAYITQNTRDETGVATAYLTGVSSSGTFPFNISIDTANDGVTDYWLINSFLNGTYGWTNRFKPNVQTTNLKFISAGANVSYIDLPCGITANSMTFNITGGNGTVVQSNIESSPSKSFVFSTANTPQSTYITLPKSSVIQSANLNVNGSVYYDYSGTLSGGNSVASSNFGSGAFSKTTSVYFNGTPNLYVQLRCSGPDAGTTTLTLVGDTQGNVGSCTYGHPYGQTYAGGFLYAQCTATVSGLKNPDNVYVTGSDTGVCYQYRLDPSSTYDVTYFDTLNQYNAKNPTNVTIYFNTSSQYKEYNYSLELNSSVGNKAVTLNTTNIQNYLNTCTTDTCNVPYYVNSVNEKGTVTINSVNVTYINSVSNLTLDVGNDGTKDYSSTGSTYSNTNITLNSTGLSAIDTYMSGTCLNRSLPLVFTSETSGNLSFSALSLNYSINPISLNYSAMNTYLSTRTGTVNIPIFVSATTWGNVTISNLNIPFYGDANYTVTANYTDGTTVASTASKIISIVWSNYTLSYPNGVSYFQFFPKTVNSTNVTPYGQSSTTPFINITGTQRDRAFNMYVRVNASYVSTANLTVSNSSTKGTNILTTSWIKLVNNLTVGSSNGLWFWLDLFNINTTSLRYLKVYPEFESKCDLCVQ